FFGRRAWPGIAVGAFLLDVRQLEPGAALVAAVAQTSMPLVVAALSGLRPTSESLARVADVVRFLAAAAAGPLVSATVATTLPVVFLVFPFALWAALRHGPGVTAIVNAVVACIAVWATSRGHGPFAGHTTTVRIVVLDAFNAAVAVSSLMLAASVATAARLSAEN